jgi:hypothetical protein
MGPCDAVRWRLPAASCREHSAAALLPHVLDPSAPSALSASALVCGRLPHVRMRIVCACVATTLIRIASTLIRMAGTLIRIASTLIRIASTLIRIASTLIRMAGTLIRIASTLIRMVRTPICIIGVCVRHTAQHTTRRMHVAAAQAEFPGQKWQRRAQSRCGRRECSETHGASWLTRVAAACDVARSGGNREGRRGGYSRRDRPGT